MEPSKPTTVQPVRPADILAAKEAKWGSQRDATMKGVEKLISQGCVGAFTNFWPNKFRDGCRRAVGFFYGDDSDHNFAAHVPVAEHQSVSRGEWGGGGAACLVTLQAGGAACGGAGLVVYHQGDVDWSPKWRRHGCCNSSGEVGHRDLWVEVLWKRERAGEDLHIRWVLSHLGVEGNVGADQLVEQGRLAHPNNMQSLPKRTWTEPQWEAPRLLEMCLDE